jgi:hypothetical protein
MLSAIQSLMTHAASVSTSAPGHTTPDWTQILIGALFVVIFAAGRFNTPPTNRYSTTLLRFYLAASCYVLFEITLYLALIFTPALVEVPAFFAPLLSGPTAAPLAALLLFVLVPKIPPLAEADGWVLEHLQRMGAIPFEARRLAAELRRSRFTVPAQLREKVVTRLVSQGFSPGEVLFAESTALEHVWTKISALMIQIEEWEIDRRFVGFLARFAIERDGLRTRYDRLAPTLQLLHGVAPEGMEGKGDRLMLHVQNELQERSAELLAAIYLFVSRGLLQCGTTYAARAAELSRLGFDANTVALKPKISLDQLIALFLAIEGTMMLGLVAFFQPGSLGYGRMLVQVTMVSIMYTVAVLCAVYPKESWSFACKDGLVRPAAFYVTAGLLATAASLAIRLVFQLAVYPASAWRHFKLYSPYSLCAFVAAVMVAWMLDDEPTPRLSRHRLRWIESLVGGGMLLLSSVMALQWIQWLAQAHEELNKILLEQPVMPAVAIGLPTVIGFGIAFLIPTWYRDAARERGLAAEPPVAPDLPPAAAAA